MCFRQKTGLIRLTGQGTPVLSGLVRKRTDLRPKVDVLVADVGDISVSLVNGCVYNRYQKSDQLVDIFFVFRLNTSKIVSGDLQ